MTERINDGLEWITHKGVRIIFNDYRGLEGPSYVDQVRENQRALEEIGKREGKHNQLHLLDVTDSVVSREVMAAFKQIAPSLEPYVKANAVLGITSIR